MPLSSREAARRRQLANLTGRPPAPPEGNRRAVKHGGFATVGRERLAEKVRELAEAMGEDLPLRSPDGGVPPADEARLSLAARAMARLEDVERYHDEYGWRDAKTGDPRPSVELERRLRSEIADHLDSLGCSPASRVRLGVDLSRLADLSTAMSEPDPEQRARALGALGLPEDEDEEAGDA